MPSLSNIDQDFAQWYQDIIYAAELADQSPVRGAFVIRPYGCALWEEIRNNLDQRIKATGHQNALFPLLIPESFLMKEAEHVEGFAPELAVVTHAGGKKLEEALVVRPTSETIIHYMFSRWIRSWRDLPLKINQWANVIRWEMRPRAFLRTTEIFWQEGHTAHETKEEAIQEVLTMLREYVSLAQDVLAIPVITGIKSNKEKFPGALETHTFEAIMPDGKALQMGTSHLLSQSFAKAFDMKFQDRDNQIAYPYLTSWGVTTRLVGAIVMVHGDQKGLILPPRVAPIQIVIIPIIKKSEDGSLLHTALAAMKNALLASSIRVHVDDSQAETTGSKFYKWELKGVPLRIEIGMRDIQNKVCIVASRLSGNKVTVNLDQVALYVSDALQALHDALYKRASERLALLVNKTSSGNLADFGPDLDHTTMAYQVGWCLDTACEDALKQYKASIRCILHENTAKHCFHCNKQSVHEVLVARSY